MKTQHVSLNDMGNMPCHCVSLRILSKICHVSLLDSEQETLFFTVCMGSSIHIAGNIRSCKRHQLAYTTASEATYTAKIKWFVLTHIHCKAIPQLQPQYQRICSFMRCNKITLLSSGSHAKSFFFVEVRNKILCNS